MDRAQKGQYSGGSYLSIRFYLGFFLPMSGENRAFWYEGHSVEKRCQWVYFRAFAAAHGPPRIANAMVKYEWR